MRPLALALVLVSLPLRAEWELLAPDGARADPGAKIAEVAGSDGARLALRRAEDGGLRLRLELGPGLLGLREDVCPSYRIDRQPAFSRAPGQPGCAAVAGGSELPLDAATLEALRRGAGLEVTVALRDAGYRAFNFSLQGSGQAIAAALGEAAAASP